VPHDYELLKCCLEQHDWPPPAQRVVSPACAGAQAGRLAVDPARCLAGPRLELSLSHLDDNERMKAATETTKLEPFAS
jgi:hypothetical protein